MRYMIKVLLLEDERFTGENFEETLRLFKDYREEVRANRDSPFWIFDRGSYYEISDQAGKPLPK